MYDSKTLYDKVTNLPSSMLLQNNSDTNYTCIHVGGES